MRNNSQKDLLLFILLLLVCAIALGDTEEVITRFTSSEILSTHIPPFPDPRTVVPNDTIEYCFRVEITDSSMGTLVIKFYPPNLGLIDDPVQYSEVMEFEINGIGMLDTFTYYTDIADGILNINIPRVEPGDEFRICVKIRILPDICDRLPTDQLLKAYIEGSVGGERYRHSTELWRYYLRCRPGLIHCCNISHSDAHICQSCADGPFSQNISSGEGMPITITNTVCNFPDYDVSANNVIAYIEIPPELAGNRDDMDFAAPIDDLVPLYGMTGTVTTDPVPEDAMIESRFAWWLIDELERDSCICTFIDLIDSLEVADSCVFYSTGLIFGNSSTIPEDAGLIDRFFTDSEFITDSIRGGYYEAYENCQGEICHTTPDLVIEMDYDFENCLSVGYPVQLGAIIRNIGSFMVDDPFLAVLYTPDTTGPPIDTILVSEPIPAGGQLDISFYPALSDCGALATLFAKVNFDTTMVEESDFLNNYSDTVEICVGLEEININFNNVRQSGEPVSDDCAHIETPNVDRTLANMSVTDQNGRPVDGLADSCWAPLSSFSTHWDPMIHITDASGTQDIYSRNPWIIQGTDRAVILVLDYSGSTSGDQDDIEDAAINLVYSTECTEEYAIVKFADNVQTMQGFTSDSTLLHNAIITSASSIGGGTQICNALIHAMGLYGTTDLPISIILFTDGYADWARYSEVIDDASDYGISINSVGIGDVDNSELTNLASETGGFFMSYSDFALLEEGFMDICDMINSTYTLAYDDSCGNEVELQFTVATDECVIGDGTLSDSDTFTYRQISCSCDLEVTKMADASIDSLGNQLPYSAGDEIDYRIRVCNYGYALCNDGDMIGLVDEISPLGRFDISSIICSEGAIDYTIDSVSTIIGWIDTAIVWQIDPAWVNGGGCISISYSYRLNNDQDYFLDNLFNDRDICNIASIESYDDIDTSNNHSSICVRGSSDPGQPLCLCPFEDPLSGDSIVLGVEIGNQPLQWEALWINIDTGDEILLASSDNASLIENTQGTYTWDTTMMAPELHGEDSELYELHIMTDQMVPDSDTLVHASCSCSVMILPPPCYIRLDRNYIDFNKEQVPQLGFSISALHKEEVDIKIYDSGGDFIRDYYWQLNPGKDTRYWDCKDSNGEYVGSGVYFITVESECAEMQTLKIAIIR
ncbi:MAG: vWA domain-containing protein [Candidatus Zixiibacteriota bacterium]